MKLLSIIAAGLSSLAAASSSTAAAVELPATFAPPQVWKNANLVHILSLEKNYVKENVNVLIENVASEPQDEYYFPFTADQMSRVGGVEVKDRKDASLGLFEVAAVEYNDEAYERPSIPIYSLHQARARTDSTSPTVIPSTTASDCPNPSVPPPSRPSASPSTTPRATPRSPRR